MPPERKDSAYSKKAARLTNLITWMLTQILRITSHVHTDFATRPLFVHLSASYGHRRAEAMSRNRKRRDFHSLHKTYDHPNHPSFRAVASLAANVYFCLTYRNSKKTAQTWHPSCVKEWRVGTYSFLNRWRKTSVPDFGELPDLPSRGTGRATPHQFHYHFILGDSKRSVTVAAATRHLRRVSS